MLSLDRANKNVFTPDILIQILLFPWRTFRISFHHHGILLQLFFEFQTLGFADLAPLGGEGGLSPRADGLHLLFHRGLGRLRFLLARSHGLQVILIIVQVLHGKVAVLGLLLASQVKRFELVSLAFLGRIMLLEDRWWRWVPVDSRRLPLASSLRTLFTLLSRNFGLNWLLGAVDRGFHHRWRENAGCVWIDIFGVWSRNLCVNLTNFGRSLARSILVDHFGAAAVVGELEMHGTLLSGFWCLTARVVSHKRLYLLALFLLQNKLKTTPRLTQIVTLSIDARGRGAHISGCWPMLLVLCAIFDWLIWPSGVSKTDLAGVVSVNHSAWQLIVETAWTSVLFKSCERVTHRLELRLVDIGTSLTRSCLGPRALIP